MRSPAGGARLALVGACILGACTTGTFFGGSPEGAAGSVTTLAQPPKWNTIEGVSPQPRPLTCDSSIAEITESFARTEQRLRTRAAELHVLPGKLQAGAGKLKITSVDETTHPYVEVKNLRLAAPTDSATLTLSFAGCTVPAGKTLRVYRFDNNGDWIGPLLRDPSSSTASTLTVEIPGNSKYAIGSN